MGGGSFGGQVVGWLVMFVPDNDKGVDRFGATVLRSEAESRGQWVQQQMYKGESRELEKS